METSVIELAGAEVTSFYCEHCTADVTALECPHTELARPDFTDSMVVRLVDLSLGK